MASVVGGSFVATSAAAAVPEVKGSVKVDGSSTVFPIAEAVAEEFQKKFGEVNVTVGVSGTGGGFKKFLAGELDVVNASRPIKPTELEAAQKQGFDFVELPVAFDALTVVVNKKNTWVDHLTVAELKKIWEPAAQGKVMSWSDIRPSFPNKPIVLFGPGTDSGTFDYFTEAIVGKEDASRGDYTSSEDDNILVKGVAGNEGGLAFLGLSYYEGNTDTLKAVPIDDGKDENGKGAQMPNTENVIKGRYQPLSRPLFIYARKDALDRPEVRAYVDFFVSNAKTYAPEVGYVALPDSTYKLTAERLTKRVAGTIFGGAGHKVGLSLEQLLNEAKGA